MFIRNITFVSSEGRIPLVAHGVCLGMRVFWSQWAAPVLEIFCY